MTADVAATLEPRAATERLLNALLAAAVLAGVWIESTFSATTPGPVRPRGDDDDGERLDGLTGGLSGDWFHELGEHSTSVSLLALFAVGLPAAVAVLIRNRWPLVAICLAGVASILGAFMFATPITVAIAFALVLYSFAVAVGWWPAGIAAAAATGSIVMAAVAADVDDSGAAVLVAILTAVVTPLLAASATRSRRAYLSEVEARLRQAELEQQARTEQALAEDRVRLAHDLHDVLAHSLTVVNMQVGVASHLLAAHPDRAEVALREARTAGDSAIAELRSTLALLRGDAPEQLAPQPGVSDLDDLFAGVAATGLPMTTQVNLGSADIPSGIALVAYRVVQEGLTNVVKHAGTRAPTTVAVSDSSGVLRINVANGPGDGPHSTGPSGIGLEGLRTRVTALHGNMTAGPTPDGGFELDVMIPLAAGVDDPEVRQP